MTIVGFHVSAGDLTYLGHDSILFERLPCAETYLVISSSVYFKLTGPG